MQPTKHEVVSAIRAAFDGVDREDGVTLHEARVLDNYGSEGERAEARDRDTDRIWEQVPDYPTRILRGFTRRFRSLIRRVSATTSPHSWSGVCRITAILLPCRRSRRSFISRYSTHRISMTRPVSRYSMRDNEARSRCFCSTSPLIRGRAKNPAKQSTDSGTNICRTHFVTLRGGEGWIKLRRTTLQRWPRSSRPDQPCPASCRCGDARPPRN